MWKPLNISSFSRMPHSGWVSTSIALSPHSLPFFVLFRLQSWLHIRIVNVSPIGVGCCWHPRLICAVTQSKGIHHLLIVWLSDGSWRWIELAKRPQSGHRSKCQLKSAVGGATAIKVVAIKCSYCYRRQMHISLNQKKKKSQQQKARVNATWRHSNKTIDLTLTIYRKSCAGDCSREVFKLLLLISMFSI